MKQTVRITICPDLNHRVTMDTCDGFVCQSNQFMRHLASIAGDKRFVKGDLHWLPDSLSTRRAVGFAWLNRDKSSVHCPVGMTPLTLHQKIHGLWLPCGSQIVPDLPEDELRDLFPSSYEAMVWLPQTGLVGMEREDRVESSAWVKMPFQSDAVSPVWETPPWVPPIPERVSQLTTVDAEDSPAVLQKIADEIGKPAYSLIQADRDGKSSQDPGRMKRAMTWFLEKIDRLVSQSPREKSPSSSESGADSGKPNRFGFARSALAKLFGPIKQAGSTVAATGAVFLSAPLVGVLAKALQGQREAEIDKLLDMMRRDPDRAISLAIPLGGIAEAFRGFSLPGSKLISRMTDFSLGGLRLTGGIDAWSIGDRHQYRLRQSYLEQAEREMSAGRYRRAAYIYAHLLGDFERAAQAMKEGKFFEEAAVLYEDKLLQPRQAAECLTDGARYEAAVAIYERLNDFQSAGDVWTQADRLDQAQIAYERAASYLLSKGDVIDAAIVTKSKLNRFDEAIELLAGQWPVGRHSIKSMETAIGWLIEENQMLPAIELTDRCVGEVPPSSTVPVVSLLSRLSSKANGKLRTRLVDGCQILASRCLDDEPAHEISRLTSEEIAGVIRSVAETRPSDRQLNRDANAYRDLMHQKRDLAKSSRNGARQFELLDTVTVAEAGRMHAVYQAAGCLFGLTHRDRYVHLHRVTLDGSQPNAMIGGIQSEGIKSPLLSLHRSEPGSPKMHVCVYANVSESRLYDKKPDAGSSLPEMVLEVRVRGDISAISTDHQGEVWLIENEDEVPVDLIGPRGEVYDLRNSVESLVDPDDSLFTRAVARALTYDQVQVASCRDTVLVALDGMIFTVPSQGNAAKGLPGELAGALPFYAELPGSIRSLTSSPIASLPRVLAATDEGLFMLFMGSGPTAIETEQAFLFGQFFPGGLVVGGTESRLLAFKMKQDATRCIAEFPMRTDDPCIGLLQLTPSVVGVAYADGTVDRVRVAR